ncbi:MAG: di-trans,poly-cis-decaprenylcistransferase [Ectothiorhodospiraceae bacterium AqS1]|nr:di-trans,poly-cis-decaprenylcistransferase [Ectothiorhodospiraceae bacterium AqS1]
MDGNGRWARRRRRPRFAGHRAGVDAVKGVVRSCAEKGIEVLTLFAFSSENWRRPAEEVSLLMELFANALDRQVRKLHQNNIRLTIIGERDAFGPALCERIASAEALTCDNSGLHLVIAANYGGRRDLVQACKEIATEVRKGTMDPQSITAESLEARMSLRDLPAPDLFIRTGGEMRISNFMIWHLAYTELHFTDILWPDFDEQAFEAALVSYAGRLRRFGRTTEQVLAAQQKG